MLYLALAHLLPFFNLIRLYARSELLPDGVVGILCIMFLGRFKWFGWTMASLALSTFIDSENGTGVQKLLDMITSLLTGGVNTLFFLRLSKSSLFESFVLGLSADCLERDLSDKACTLRDISTGSLLAFSRSSMAKLLMNSFGASGSNYRWKEVDCRFPLTCTCCCIDSRATFVAFV